MPAATPVTTPDVEIVATPVLLLVHRPPVDVLLNVVVEPAHTTIVPVMAAGSGCTVSTAVRSQPAVEVYTMVDVPVPKPEAIPEALPIVAMAGLLLDHVPPVVVLVSVVVLPSQTVRAPLIAAGSAFTVKPVTLRQVVGRV